jgi:hypothetical protein
MGYTHYWVTKKSTGSNWKKFSEACKKLAANLPITADTKQEQQNKEWEEYYHPEMANEPTMPGDYHKEYCEKR